MKVGIRNLHNMCENNTLFLSQARRYFQLNGHIVIDGDSGVELVFVGGCAVTDMMRGRCEEIVLKSMQQFSQAQFVIFGCMAAFPEALQSLAIRYPGRLHIIPYEASRQLDELIHARIPFDAVSANQLIGHVSYQPHMGSDDCYVLIAQGCINNCSYCNIKKVKGNVISRREEAIEDEIRELYKSGVRTVTLLADDCGSYGLDQGSSLPCLLARLSRTARDLSYKLYTVFPSLFLMYATQIEPFFQRHRVPYICLPVQSASRRILSLMNRSYDPDHLAEITGRLRILDPEVFVYSHFIYNFPTETWEEFEQSIAFARHFDNSVFIGYGENAGTKAATIVPKCGSGTLQAKTQLLKELVRRGDLSALVVPSP